MVFTNLKRGGSLTGDENNSGAVTTFGELSVAEMNPVAQGDFVHGINQQTFNTSLFSGGTISIEDNMAVLESGTNTSGSAVLQLRRNLKYKAGQGALMRATALFGTGSIAGSHPDTNSQYIGMGNAESGYFIGYFAGFEGKFGILHVKTGAREVRAYTVTSAAGTNNITVTLNGDSITIPIVGAASTSQTAYQLSLANYKNVGEGWETDVKGSTVYFISSRSGPKDSTFNISGGSIVGTFAREIVGIEQEKDFIPQETFNKDKLDGSGPSGMIFNSGRGNVFQIGFQYLGFGNAKFGIENPETGTFFTFHEVKNANSLLKPVLKNPNVSIMAACSNNAGATESIKLKTVSMVAFTEGKVAKLDPKFARSRSFDLGTAGSGIFHPIMALKVDKVFNNTSCFGSMELLKIALASDDSGGTQKAITVGLFLDENVNGNINFLPINQNQSLVSVADLTPGVNSFINANITPFYEITVATGNSYSQVLSELDFSFGPNSKIIIAAKCDTNNVTGTVSLNWYEQQ